LPKTISDGRTNARQAHSSSQFIHGLTSASLHVCRTVRPGLQSVAPVRRATASFSPLPHHRPPLLPTSQPSAHPPCIRHILFVAPSTSARPPLTAPSQYTILISRQQSVARPSRPGTGPRPPTPPPPLEKAFTFARIHRTGAPQIACHRIQRRRLIRPIRKFQWTVSKTLRLPYRAA